MCIELALHTAFSFTRRGNETGRVNGRMQKIHNDAWSRKVIQPRQGTRTASGRLSHPAACGNSFTGLFELLILGELGIAFPLTHVRGFGWPREVKEA
jgi:hypothetical protein